MTPSPRPHPLPRRTFDDPDVWANFLVVIPSIIYVHYNAYILSHTDQYGTYDLYVQADIAYFVGAIFYLIAALRDDGWFFWCTTAGQCMYGLDTQQPMMLPATYDAAAAASLSVGLGKQDAAVAWGPSAERAADGGLLASLQRGVSGALVAVIMGAGWAAAGVGRAGRQLFMGKRPEQQSLIAPGSAAVAGGMGTV